MLVQDEARPAARMTADDPRTSDDDSRRRRDVRAPGTRAVLPRTVLGLTGGAGVALLVLATFATVIQISVGTVDRLQGLQTAFSGWDRHGPALLLLAVVAGLMLLGAVRGARPAMAAVAALGVVALLIAVATDLPDAGETGRVGELYAEARAEPALGFYAETLGGALLAVAGGGLLILSGGRAPARPPREL